MRTVVIPSDCYPLTWPLGTLRTKTPARSQFHVGGDAARAAEINAALDQALAELDRS